MNLPVPKRGYWAKVEAGKKVRKAVLPAEAKMTATDMELPVARYAGARWSVAKRDAGRIR